MRVLPLHLWTDQIQSICCHRQHHQYCWLADWTLKGSEANNLLQSNGKLSNFVQSPLNAPPTWLSDGNSAEQEVTSQGHSISTSFSPFDAETWPVSQVVSLQCCTVASVCLLLTLKVRTR